MVKVITYQAPNGLTINLTPQQIAMLEAAQVWPRNHRGEEYCTVSHGLHGGQPTFTDAGLRAEVGMLSFAAMSRGQGGDWELHGEFRTADEARSALSTARARGYSTRIIERNPAVSGGEKIVENRPGAE